MDFLRLLLGSCLFLSIAPNAQETGRLAFVDVNVIDVEQGQILPNQTVVISENRIVSVGASVETALPPDARVIDGTNRYLIPGLWDMHVHLAQTDLPYRQEVLLKLLVANGVTGVRDLGSNLAEVTQIREQIRQGTLLGPRLVVSGPMLDGPDPLWPSSVGVATEAQARDAVSELAEGGADFIKVQSMIPREAYAAVADEATRRGLALAGHVPLAVSTVEAVEWGHISIEHVDDLAYDVSERAGELKAAFRQLMETGSWPNSAFLQLQQEANISFNRMRANEVYQALSINDVWLCPTLGVIRVYVFPTDARWASDPNLRYVPLQWLEEAWTPAMRANSEGLQPVHAIMAQDTMRNQQRIVREVHEAGGGILAGTDTPSVPHMIPGFSLHEELAELVEAGLSPEAALRAATINPASFLDAEQSLGTVAVGKLADLILLDGNPLEDIRNTEQIRAVVLGGELIDREMLDSLLSSVESLQEAP